MIARDTFKKYPNQTINYNKTNRDCISWAYFITELSWA